MIKLMRSAEPAEGLLANLKFNHFVFLIPLISYD